ncbi:hypothetical protein NDN01_22600 [Sphingomonas sp. QA11]|uniref:hypothetical protein n=1 Tax=Sphingomonas sp. QA11 TaxID=2950605 RepID=UPI00234BAB4E|nr:hypothetical protein [Sphingomonas sp. QA11]WCM26755.1 hypothetical protein NDN01_22600 [Sphingomonas sp. QA11]
MADNKSKRGVADRRQVADEGYEVNYFARKHGITKDQAESTQPTMLAECVHSTVRDAYSKIDCRPAVSFTSASSHLSIVARIIGIAA